MDRIACLPVHRLALAAPEELRRASWAADARAEDQELGTRSMCQTVRAVAERSGGAGGQLLTATRVGPRWLSRIDPRRFGAALGRGDRERERGREREAGKARSSDVIGATGPRGRLQRLDAVHDNVFQRRQGGEPHRQQPKLPRAGHAKDQSTRRQLLAGTRAQRDQARPGARAAAQERPREATGEGPERPRPEAQNQGSGAQEASMSESAEHSVSKSPG